ncbi:MAG: hypothetical protein M0Z92_07160 [Actinomycetota bacterium]|nr:hypothetical protein [Actinomycetota bacterium]
MELEAQATGSTRQRFRLGGLRLPIAAAGLLLATTLPSAALLSQAAPAAAATSGSVSFSGHGWGHGRGAGQWGQLGYALEGGWNANQILLHYYSNTTIGSTQDVPIRVILTANDGSDIVVTSSSTFSVAGTTFAAGSEVRMHLNTNGSWEIDLSSNTTGCSTTPTWSAVGTVAQSSAVASPNTNAYSTETYSNALAVCEGGTPYYYRGQIAASSYNGSPRTLNVVDVENYLRGVVPSESPAYWGTLGSTVATGTSAGNQPAGFYALMAQAVEARSYALSSMGEFGYADICDSAYCQVYRGMQGESPITDQAVAATAGEVMILNGAIARTEFSSSTGGYTAGGTFPAVVDTYDSVCVTYACNPNHNWSSTLTLAQLQGDFPTLGTLQGLTVTQRNGYGDWGGRVMSITVSGSNGSVTISGEQFAWDVGINSDWFTFTGTGITLSPDSAAASTTPTSGFYVDSSAGGVAAVGTAAAYGSMAGTTLNKPIVGMAATWDGGGYWLVASDGGIFTFGDAQFYGSTGGMTLNKPIVGMAATPDGKGYWLVASDGGIFTFGDAPFVGSMPGAGETGTATSLAPAAGVNGYYVLTTQGNVYSFGQAPSVAGASSALSGLPGTLVGIATIPNRPNPKNT